MSQYRQVFLRLSQALFILLLFLLAVDLSALILNSHFSPSPLHIHIYIYATFGHASQLLSVSHRIYEDMRRFNFNCRVLRYGRNMFFYIYAETQNCIFCRHIKQLEQLVCWKRHPYACEFRVQCVHSIGKRIIPIVKYIRVVRQSDKKKNNIIDIDSLRFVGFFGFYNNNCMCIFLVHMHETQKQNKHIISLGHSLGHRLTKSIC